MAVKIMCVDDSPTIRSLMEQSLTPEGFDVVTAENGKDALAKLSHDIGMFIVDVNMPEMDGFAFVKNLKEKDAFKGKPVVFLTTESAADKKQQGKELGVNGWIVKPFEPESLLKVINMLVD